MSARPGYSPAPATDLPGARCIGAAATEFFPEDYERRVEALDRMRLTAVQYCRPCPARVDCDAIGQVMDYGVWGGRLRRPNAKPINLLEAGQ